MTIRHGRLSLAVLPLIVLVFAFSVAAQDLDDVTITGRVADSNGLAIVGATVKATHIETGVERTVVTNDEGRYRLIELRPGLYKVAASQTGFGTKERADLQTVSGQNVQIDFQLAPADVQAGATVTVTEDDAPAVDVTRTVVGGTVTQREIEELPNATRDPFDLVFTLGGVTEEPLSTRDLAGDRGTRGSFAQGSTPEEAGTFALSGGAAYSNNITIDGLDNNDDRSAGFRFQPSIDSVAEVQVVTNQFSSEYGRASGGRVNIRTRAGSNRYRGRAFFFFRDDNLNANTWNNNRRDIPRAKYTNYDPGATFSGPIVKNKLFFFTSYEFDKVQEDTLIDVFVPFNNLSRLTLPAPTEPTVYPSNTGANSIPIGQYFEFVDTPSKKHLFSTRVDWNLNQANNFTFGYQMGRSNDLRQFSGTNRLADALIGRVRDSDAFNATHNLILSSHTVNQARFQFSKLRPSSAPSSGEMAPVVIVGGFTPPGEPFSASQIFSASTSGSSDRKEDRIQIQDTLTHVIGSHSLKFGGDFQNVKTLFIDRFDATGTYRFSNFFFFNQNNVTSFQQNFNTESELENRYIGVFFQDEWRFRPNLTFSYGLRYERETVIDDDNNFGPRVSVAWNPFKGDKTVVRAGAGIFYNRVLLRTVDDFTAGSQEIRFDSRILFPPNVEFNRIRTFLSSQFPNPLTLDTAIQVNATETMTVEQLSRRGGFRDLDPTIKIPESYQFNVGFEREIAKGIVFETNFTLNKTIRLWREYNINAPVLPANTPDRDQNGVITFTDYLLGLTTSNGAQRFFLGSPTDDDGTSGTCTGINQNRNCIVNLRSSQNRSDCDSALDPVNGPTDSPICQALGAIQHLRPFFSEGNLSQFERVASIGQSNYRGITFELRNRFRRFGYGFGGAMRFAYTLSSLKDDGIVNTSSAQIVGDFASEYSRSLLDRRHRIAFSGTFDTPNWLGKLRFSPLFRFGSSAPFNISVGGNDRNLDDVSTDRPDFSGDLDDIVWREFGSAFPDALAGQFSQPTIGSPGNLPRNAGKGPRYYIFDLNLSRQFKFTERYILRPSIEFGNILNMTVFGFGSNFINFDGLNSTNAITRQNARDILLSPTRTYRPRQIRLGMRFEF